MTSADLLADGFERVRGVVHSAVAGLSREELAMRLAPESNTIGWLVWHLTRVQDDHVAGVAGIEQLWTSAGWAEKFDLPFPNSDIGYGHSSEQVGQVTVESPRLLTDYYDAVHERTVRFVSRLREDDLARVVDESWDPPVTMAVRLVSVLSDDLQHAGQAAFVRGVLSRR